jgi:hypothetical protein
MRASAPELACGGAGDFQCTEQIELIARIVMTRVRALATVASPLL